MKKKTDLLRIVKNICISETKLKYEEKINELDKDLVRKTDIGEYGLFESKKVPLDIPFINEEYKFTDLVKIKNHLKNKGFKTL